MKIIGIMCVNNMGYVGKDGGLLYHISEDLKRFKKITENGCVLMGYKTAISLPNSKPLPNRLNLVYTERELPKEMIEKGFERVDNVNQAKYIAEIGGFDKIHFIGGVQVAYQIKHEIDEWLLTMVMDDKLGDVGFVGGLEFFDNFPNISETQIIEQTESGDNYYFEHLTK